MLLILPVLTLKFLMFVTAGNIVLKSKLDRETTDSYHLIIQAADGGTPSKNTTTMVCMQRFCWHQCIICARGVAKLQQLRCSRCLKIGDLLRNGTQITVGMVGNCLNVTMVSCCFCHLREWGTTAVIHMHFTLQNPWLVIKPSELLFSSTLGTFYDVHWSILTL